MSLFFLTPRRALAAGVLFASSALAHAQVAFNVNLDTSNLVGSLANPLYIDFQLNDGSFTANGNNTATISNFAFGGGSALPDVFTFGGASGDLTSSVQLTDTDFSNEFFQAFVPGSWLSFTVSLTTNVDSPAPDLFSFALLDSSMANLPTDSWGNDVFVEVAIDSESPAIYSFGSAALVVGAPAIVPVPEPSTYALWASALLLILGAVRRRANRT